MPTSPLTQSQIQLHCASSKGGSKYDPLFRTVADKLRLITKISKGKKKKIRCEESFLNLPNLLSRILIHSYDPHVIPLRPTKISQKQQLIRFYGKSFQNLFFIPLFLSAVGIILLFRIMQETIHPKKCGVLAKIKKCLKIKLYYFF